jgi:hypothetical protein
MEGGSCEVIPSRVNCYSGLRLQWSTGQRVLRIFGYSLRPPVIFWAGNVPVERIDLVRSFRHDFLLPVL